MKSALKEFDGWQKRSHVGEQQQRLVDLSYAASYIPIHSNLLCYTQQLTFLYTATYRAIHSDLVHRNVTYAQSYCVMHQLV